jgi:hypothetical protein
MGGKAIQELSVGRPLIYETLENEEFSFLGYDAVYFES